MEYQSRKRPSIDRKKYDRRDNKHEKTRRLETDIKRKEREQRNESEKWKVLQNILTHSYSKSHLFHPNIGFIRLLKQQKLNLRLCDIET